MGLQKKKQDSLKFLCFQMTNTLCKETLFNIQKIPSANVNCINYLFSFMFKLICRNLNEQLQNFEYMNLFRDIVLNCYFRFAYYFTSSYIFNTTPIQHFRNVIDSTFYDLAYTMSVGINDCKQKDYNQIIKTSVIENFCI